ncbi:MAG: TlpA disulfide reductase family protein [Pseudomonadota bacterium]
MGRGGLVVLLLFAMGAGYMVSQAYHQTETRGGGIELPASDDSSASGEFVLNDLSGKEARLSDWRGKVRIVNIWATWCAPCRKEIPLLKAIQAEHGASGIQVLGIAHDEEADVRNFADETGFNYPILGAHGSAGDIAAGAFDIELFAMPLTFIVAPDGALLYAHYGELKQSHIDAAMPVLRQLLAGEISSETARASLSDS